MESISASVEMYNQFAARESGTYELWVRATDVGGGRYFGFNTYDGTDYATYIYISAGYIQYYDTSWHQICAVSTNTWYHISIDFECGAGGYKGLSADKFNIYVDGTKYGPYNFRSAKITVNRLYIFCHTNDDKDYVDAIGYSWDSNYNIGDNIHWENYKDLMSEAYFEGEELYTEGTDINFIDYYNEMTNTYVKIVPSFDEHKKILECYDSNSANRWAMENIFSSNQVSGTVEGYVWSTNVGYGYTTYIVIAGDTFGQNKEGPAIRMNYGKLERQKSDSNWVAIISSGITANTKYHWRIDFECGSGSYEGLSADTYYLYWDGTKYGPYEFRVAQNNLDRFQSMNGVTAANYYSYFDAIGYSWESDYNIGDNLYGSRLLSCITTFHLNNIENDESIKYLKLFYAFKAESSALVNISIFNFHSESWMLIKSITIGSEIYRNKYSILNAEYINDTYDILVKIESDTLIGEFYLDQLRLEYYSAKTSDSGQFEHEYIPIIPDDFYLTCGTCDWNGTLSENDDEYITFTSGESNENEGHYPATYSFEDEVDGSDPQGWIDYYSNARIISELSGHKKVYEFYDSSSTSYSYVYNQFSSQFYGTVEYWIRTTDATKRTDIRLRNVGEGKIVICIKIEDDKFQYFYSGSWNDIRSASDNIWYHLRIDFETTTGGYYGLSQWNWHIYIDNQHYGDYNLYHNYQVERFDFTSGYSDSGYYTYVDAVGYSWDSNYKPGDNCYWYYYNDISSDFESEDTNIEGENISFVDTDASDANCKAQIIPSFDGHKKVLELYDNNGVGNADIYNNFDSAQAYGTYDLWVKASDVSKGIHILPYENANIGPHVYTNGEQWGYYDGGFNAICSASDNTWYHIRVDFETGGGGYQGLSADTFYVYINSIKYGPYNFRDSCAALTKFRLATATSTSGFYMYADAIGYSWDSNYNIGDNLHSPLELIFISKHSMEGVHPDDKIDSINLVYSIKTNVSQEIDLSLYNYTAQSYTKVNTSMYVDFKNCSYSIDSSDYYSEYFEVKVKFKGENSSMFKFFLNQLKLQYSWTKGSYKDEDLWTDVPDPNVDFMIINGTFESEGDLLFQDNDYATFSSTSKTLNFDTQFKLEKVLPGDIIDSLCLNYSLKTDIIQLINISLYNFTANEWHLIDSSISTSFSNESYLIPISRFETVNDSIIEYNDFHNSNFNILVKIEGVNESSDFELYFDMFKVEYKFTSYYFKGNCTANIDAIEGDYMSFDSSQYSGEYYGTYSFENDENGNTPSGWVRQCYEGYKTEVISEFQGHKKVLRCYDPFEDQYRLFRYFSEGHSSGTIEFWMATSSTSKSNGVWLTCNQGGLLAVYMDDGYLRYYDKSGWHNLITISANAWYHIRIDFEQTGNNYTGLGEETFRLVIDGSEYGPYNCANSYDTTYLKLISGTADYPYYGYYDAFGFSWDADYNVGDNYYETCYVNETFDLTLDKIDAHRFDLFESCELTYSIKTSITQEISVSIYNFTGEIWTGIDSLTTNNSMFYNGSYIFDSKDFINSDYKVKVQFYGKNYSEQEFDFYVSTVEAKYNWSYVNADFGISSYLHSLDIYYNMSSRYSTIFYKEYMFEYAGSYLITMSADDGYSTSKTGMLIQINNTSPFAAIGDFPDQTIEDKKIDFNSDFSIAGTNTTNSDYRAFWLFGDGSFSNEENPVHAYANSGVYNVSLTVRDCFGGSFTHIRNITIQEKAPEIIGPYTFYGVEGQAITLDVDIFDAFLDEIDMEYEWFNSSGLFSTDKRPSLILQDGSYDYTLNVTDSLGKTATADISMIVEDAPPVVIAQSYMYSGASVAGTEGFFAGSADDPGELVLTAYGYDISDNSDLDYHWTVYKGDEIFDGGVDWDSGISSTRKFRVTDTVLYRGEVKIVSAEKSTVTTFLINSFIDDNGNGFSNEFEERLAETGENITAYSDADEDCLSDLYEIGISNTSYLDPDTDGDGLFDGFDPDTGIGEWTAGTDPLDWDCDSDSLSDGIEVIGWKVSNELLGEVIVSSDPWDNDTDDEDLSDYEEYYTGTDPRNSDTDNDGANDKIDPHPLKWDGDEDGLCDGLELQLGTNPNNTDSDSDGISDGEEVIGWAFKTNPLTSDSDRDFVADTAEYQNYKVAIDDRYNLDDPVNISFEVNCEKAMAAQIAFLITFGEAIDENEKVYGIQDVPDLNVTIYKVDDDLLLFNMTTNSTRYFSQVVDIRETMENHSLDYRGEYMIKINNKSAGCILEQFEIDITGYLDPNDEDFDDDGIIDGVEMGLLVNGTDTLNFTDSYWYDNLTVNYFRTKPFVISVEHAEFDIPSGTMKKSVELNSSQDIANCVPFMTKEVIASTSDDWDDIMVDIYFEEGPKITAERNQGGGALSLSIFVVEFDPSFIKVQQGSISFAGTSDTDSIDQVATDKTAMVFYYRHAFDQDDWNDLRVCGYFSASNTLTWERHASSGDVIGHFYVFEANHDQFTVQSTSFTIGSTSTSATGALSNAVDMSKSFVIASFKTDRGDDNAEQGSCDVWLDTNTTVKAERYATSNTITIKAFVVEFSEFGAENVQRGVFSYGSTEDQKTADIDYVYLWRSMVHNPVCGGQMRAAQGGSTDAMRAWQKLTFENETMIQGDISVGNTGNAATGHWEVIQWDVQTGYYIDPEPITDEFYLEIPDIGRVYDANITVKVESEGTPIGLGKVNITLIKEELNCSIEDVVLIDYFGEFDNSSAFTYENFLDLTDYVNNGTILDYYGTYLLEITIFDTNYTHDNFTLSEFYILTDTYIDAGPTDTHAWYTNPAIADSDFDGWNDYKEIFIEETNPLNPDTDFDGVWDSFDRDPKRDVMLEICPISASVPGGWKLKIVIKFTVDGDKYYMPTPKLKANVFEDPLYTAYYDLHYYIDISDDKRIPNDYDLMRFDIELWRVNRYWHGIRKWDKRLVSGDEYYYIETPGHDDILTVEKLNGESEIKYQAKVKVKTIGIEKANTIAVYEINDTSFTGHYQEAERMNIIQLYINDTPPSSSPFVKGPNCIVIPTSLFTETILNGYIQTERLDETALYSSEKFKFMDLEKFKFISIERDGSAEQACGEVDFVMVRFDISYEDAEEIFDLILTCVVNETLDENNNTIAVNATLYTYVSTKLNGTSAVMLNLPDAALGYVPWFCQNESSELGGKPLTKSDWFWKPWKKIGGFLLGIILSPFMLAAAIWDLITVYVLEIIKMFILPILEYILWLIIRVILLVFFFILLAIEVIATTPLFLAMGLILMAFSGLMDITIDWGVNLIPAYGKDTRIGFIHLNMHGDNMLLEAWIKWDYWEYFDLYIPLLDMNFDADTDDIMDNVPEEPSDGTGTLLTCGFNQVDDYKFDFETTYWDTPYNDPPEYVILTLVSPSGQSYNYTMEISPTGYKSIDYWVGKEDIRTGETYIYDEINNTFIPPNWYRGVRYNVTVDFEEEFTSNQRAGRWYYQFHAKASRVNSSGVKWPVESYAIGPHFNNSGVVSNECNAQYLLYEDLYPYLGGSNKEFNFSVWWADYENNTLPTEVALKLSLANGSVISCGMTNVSSYQIDYSPVSDYGNVTFTEYKCSLNLSQYVEDEPVSFWHYYEGVHSSGNITMLTDIQYVDERGNILSEADYWECENVTEVRVWFGGPQVFPITNGEPIIRKWVIEDLTYNTDLQSFGWANPLYEEQEFRFWVYVYDPDRSPDYDEFPTCFNYSYPKLILTNRDNPNNPIVYDNFIWNGYDYDLEADRYWIRVNADELGPGFWDFEFIMKDEQNNTDHLTKYDLPELWIVGSVAEIFSTLRDTIFYYGYIPISAFLTCAFISSFGGTYGQIIAIVVSMGVAIGFIIGALVVSEDMRKNSNSGGLLGHGWALFTIVLSILIGLKVGDMLVNPQSWKGLVNILNIGQSILLTTTMFAFASDDTDIVYDLLFYFSDFIGLTSYSFTLGFSIGVASKKAKDTSMIIKKTIEIYAVALFFTAIWCIYLSGVINGFYSNFNK